MGLLSKLKKFKSEENIDAKDTSSDGHFLSKILKKKPDESTSLYETVNPPDDGPEFARKRYVPPGHVAHGIWVGPLGSCRTDLCSERGITHILNCSREVRLLGWVDFGQAP